MDEHKTQQSIKEYEALVCGMQLLMKEKVTMPEKKTVQEVMNHHLGDVEMMGYDQNAASFLAKKYLAQVQGKAVPPQLLLTGCIEFNETLIEDITRRQMWNCQEDRDRILSECKYQVIATDFFGASMSPYHRADMLMDYMEALLELFPTCEAVYFQNSGKMFLADQIRYHEIPREDRFIYFTVNVRFFNIFQQKNMLVDTIGMGALHLPDLQYYFHDMDPNWVVSHAYSIASYNFENGNVIKDGDTIDGMINGEITEKVSWKCRYAEALIGPKRPVIDVHMNEYAVRNEE